MIYRAAEMADLPALQELALASYGRLQKEMSPENWNKMQAVLTSEDTFPKLVKTCFALVCEEDKKLLGMAFLVPSGNPTKVYTADTSYIRMVGVHPDAGGRGIAQQLTNLCVKRARATGEKMVSLHSAEVMYAARHIYEKQGFKKIKLLDEHYGLVYWFYEMEII